MDPRTQRLLEAPLLPLILKLAAPNVSGFLAQSAVILVEVWMIGQLGTEPLAAIALVFPLLILLLTVSGGAVGGAISSSVARYLGAGDADSAGRLIWQSITLCLAAYTGFLLIYALFGAAFLAWMGGAGNILTLALAYADVLMWGGLTVWLTSGLGAIFRGMGLMGFSAGAMVAGYALQVLVSGALILGWFGVSPIGIAGAAYSTVLVSGLMALVYLLRLMGPSLPSRLTWERRGYRQELMEDILRVARPAALSPVVTVATVIGLTALVARVGDVALAGYGVGARIEFLITPIVLSIGASLTALVGTCVGAGNRDRAIKASMVGAGLAAVIGAGIGLPLALAPMAWIPLFTGDADVAAMTTTYIQYAGPCYAFLAVGLVLYFAAQGAGRMRWPVIATFVRFSVAVGGAYLWVAWGGGFEAIIMMAAAGMVLYGAIILLSLKLGAWR